MKVIPTDELIILIFNRNSKLISKSAVDDIFEEFGDSYYYDRCLGDFELCKESEARKRYFESEVEE